MPTPPPRTSARRDDFRRLRTRARVWSVSTWLIAACVAGFVLQITVPPTTGWGAFTVGHTAIGQIWRPISFQFLHGGLFHLGFNCLGLWVFGPMVERKLGRARTLALYLIGGVGGAVGFTLLWATGLIRADLGSPLIGASAGVFALIAAAMALVPDRILQLALPPIDITVFRFGLVYLGLAVFVVIAYGGSATSNAGGEAAHLGGAAVGYVLAKRASLLDWADKLVPAKLRSPGRRGTPRDVKAPSYMKYHGWR